MGGPHQDGRGKLDPRSSALAEPLALRTDGSARHVSRSDRSASSAVPPRAHAPLIPSAQADERPRSVKPSEEGLTNEASRESSRAHQPIPDLRCERDQRPPARPEDPLPGILIVLTSDRQHPVAIGSALLTVPVVEGHVGAEQPHFCPSASGRSPLPHAPRWARPRPRAALLALSEGRRRRRGGCLRRRTAVVGQPRAVSCMA
jgi:hypothetical protein